jgi:hypothetical protein
MIGIDFSLIPPDGPMMGIAKFTRISPQISHGTRAPSPPRPPYRAHLLFEPE